ncbi:hypothetical protein BGZ90_010148 [Linnemannia elongata]|nr:hypothetical protein BGZ90_010148 [Linnemannia elongata]
MINNDHDILSSSGNPVHLSEGSNPAHHQATSSSSSPSPSLSQLLSQLDPTALQVLAAAISPHLPQQPTPAPFQAPSPEPDPYLVSPDQTKTLQLYDRLVELCPSLKISNLHNAQLDKEEAEYIDIKRFSKTANVDYTPPPLPTNHEIKDYVKRQDKEWVTFASKVAQLTRPIDATMHALVRCSNPDDDAIISNVLETLNILRLNIASICSEVTKSLLSKSNFLRLCIVRPKETSGGIHSDKHTIVQAHPSEPILCPVNTIRAYLDRHAHPILKSPHLTLLDLTINPLIRYTKDATSAFSSQRIPKHIKSLIVLMPLANCSIPKSRAAGSTIAALKGVPIDDVITQGNWASHSTCLRFYRISSRTRTNFTSVLVN